MKTTGYKDEPFYILGHNLGGYLAALYSIRYPEHINGVILMSPAGFPSSPNDFSTEKFIHLKSNSPTKKFVYKKLADRIGTNWSAFPLLRQIGYYGAKTALENHINTNMHLNIPEDEK